MFLLFVAPAWGQDDPTDAAVEAAAEGSAPAEESPEPASEEPPPVVDEGSYIDAEDDDFRPSEEIPADQSIPFPTDI